MIKKLKNKSILILGLGREGRDSLSFFRKKFPKKKIGVADQERKDLDEKEVKTYFGENYLSAIKDYDVIIKSPGIPFSQIKELTEDKIVTNQTDIFLSKRREDVLGVTGTKGKSTTCLSIYNILKEKSDLDVYLLGNIGEPVLNYMDKEGIFIYELSSFQLQMTRTSPHISVFLNIFKDHLDQHVDFDDYVKSKFNICKFQKESDLLIYNEDDGLISELVKETNSKRIPFDPKEKMLNSAVYLDPILKTCNYFGISRSEAMEVIENIDFLPHRLEVIGTYKGIKFINDSAATIPEASIEAITSTDNAETLITGGVDKGGDYSKLAEKIAESSIKTLILFPDTGKKVKRELEKITEDLPLIIESESMEHAVKKAYKKTSGGVCIMSPASSSFNMFSNYKDRGNQFKKFVKKYGNKF